MPPTSARILLTAVLVSGLAGGFLTSQVIFFVLALGAGVLLAASLSTARRPLTRALLGFSGSVVEVRIWGALPPLPSGATLILTSVNVLGAGFHVFFRVSGGGSIHLKVAQPSDARIANDSVVVGAARYVQWNGKKLAPIGDAPALFIKVSEARVEERRERGA